MFNYLIRREPAGGSPALARGLLCMDDLPEVLPLHQAAKVLSCSTRTLRRRISDGELRASQVAGRGGWVVQRADLLAFLDSRATRARVGQAIAPPRPAPLRPTSRPAGTSGRLTVTPDMGRW
jgi:excisionase family DNA binding protein